MYLLFKRSNDLLFSFLAIIFFIPIFLIISLLIKLDSVGPILFLTKRTGKDNKKFIMFKFRTMTFNSSTENRTTSSNDDRITRVGKLLRKLKFDELPQLFNVFLGDMSIIGPRPELPYYTDQYSKEEKIILKVKPGITDFSSIEFYNLPNLVPDENPNEFFETTILKTKNTLRIRYANEISLITDMKIFFLTIKKMILLIWKN